MGSLVNSPIDLQIPVVPETSDPKVFGDLSQVYNALRQLQVGVTKYTGAAAADTSDWSTITPQATLLAGNLHRLYVKAFVAVNAGQMVNLFNNAGVLGAQLATTALQAQAFCSTTGTTAAGSYMEVTLLEGYVAIGGVTPGTPYYAAAAGAITATSGTQFIGIGVASGILYFKPNLS
jgi:hypothetical protein